MNSSHAALAAFRRTPCLTHACLPRGAPRIWHQIKTALSKHPALNNSLFQLGHCPSPHLQNIGDSRSFISMLAKEGATPRQILKAAMKNPRLNYDEPQLIQLILEETFSADSKQNIKLAAELAFSRLPPEVARASLTHLFNMQMQKEGGDEKICPVLVALWIRQHPNMLALQKEADLSKNPLSPALAKAKEEAQPTLDFIQTLVAKETMSPSPNFP